MVAMVTRRVLCKEYSEAERNILHPDGSTATGEINAWFSVRIKKQPRGGWA
jgi:hypothetical protein